jgi:hypothetical protein
MMAALPNSGEFQGHHPKMMALSFFSLDVQPTRGNSQ